MNKIKVFIVDDHSLFIEGLYSLLDEEFTVEIVGHSTNPQDVLKTMKSINADVFLVDINMPQMSGTALTRLMLDTDPGAKVLALTMYNDFRNIEAMIQSGAIGYALKSDKLNELVKAIQTVAKGEKYISKSIHATIVDKIGSIHKIHETQDIKQGKLTKREVEILLLIIKEFQNKQIAEMLFISESTVETHRRNILLKTNTNSALGLLKYAIAEGIVKM